MGWLLGWSTVVSEGANLSNLVVLFRSAKFPHTPDCFSSLLQVFEIVSPSTLSCCETLARVVPQGISPYRPATVMHRRSDTDRLQQESVPQLRISTTNGVGPQNRGLGRRTLGLELSKPRLGTLGTFGPLNPIKSTLETVPDDGHNTATLQLFNLGRSLHHRHRPA